MTATPGGVRDEAAFEQLYRETRVPVLAYLLRRTDDPADAADLLADVYLTAWRRVADVPAGDAARPWLYAVARNLLANHRRRGASHGALVAALQRELAVRAPADDDVLRDAVGDALDRLDPVDRELVQLAIWEQLPPAEIAVVTGRSPGAVRVRLHRARRVLRLALVRNGALPVDDPGYSDDSVVVRHVALYSSVPGGRS